MVRPKKLGHVVLKVRDVGRSEAFYSDLLGLSVTTRTPGRMVFLSASDEASHELPRERWPEGDIFQGRFPGSLDEEPARERA